MTKLQRKRSSLAGVRIVADFHCGSCQVLVTDNAADLSSWTKTLYGQEEIHHSILASCPLCGKDIEFNNPTFG